jgi:hypothetical protein
MQFCSIVVAVNSSRKYCDHEKNLSQDFAKIGFLQAGLGATEAGVLPYYYECVKR